MNFLKVVKNESENKAELYIYGDIVDDSWNFGWEDDPNVYPKNIKNMLKDFNNQDIDVHINSGGGHVFAGVAISNMLKQYKGKTTAYIDGIAASSASIIAFGCDEILIPSNAFLMIHKPTSFEGGTADDLRKCADMLDAIQRGIVSTYMTKANEHLTENQVDEMINAETWLTGIEASDFFNVKVVEDVQVLNCSGEMLKQWKHVPQAFNQNKKEEKEFQKIKNMQQDIEIALAL